MTTLPDDDTLVALVERMADGDTSAAADLWDATSPFVHAALLRMLRDPAAAELLTRRTFIEIWRAAPMWDQHVGRPLLWSLAMARSLGTQHLAEQRRSRAVGPATEAPTREERDAPRDQGSQVGGVLARLEPVTRDRLEAAWYDHPEDDGVRTPAPESLDEPLRAFARALAGG